MKDKQCAGGLSGEGTRVRWCRLRLVPGAGTCWLCSRRATSRLSRRSENFNLTGVESGRTIKKDEFYSKFHTFTTEVLSRGNIQSCFSLNKSECSKIHCDVVLSRLVVLDHLFTKKLFPPPSHDAESSFEVNSSCDLVKMMKKLFC